MLLQLALQLKKKVLLFFSFCNSYATKGWAAVAIAEAAQTNFPALAYASTLESSSATTVLLVAKKNEFFLSVR